MTCSNSILRPTKRGGKIMCECCGLSFATWAGYSKHIAPMVCLKPIVIQAKGLKFVVDRGAWYLRVPRGLMVRRIDA